MPLSPKKQRFVAEFLVDCVGKDAAIRAGYSAKSAAQIACNLLAQAEVAAAIAEAQREFAAKCEVTTDAVVAELATIAFLKVAGPETASLLGVKRLALVDLGRHLGMFIDRSESRHTIAADETITALLERIAANGRRIQDR